MNFKRLEEIDDWELVDKKTAKELMEKVGLSKTGEFELYKREVIKTEYAILGLMENAKPVYFSKAK